MLEYRINLEERNGNSEFIADGDVKNYVDRTCRNHGLLYHKNIVPLHHQSSQCIRITNFISIENTSKVAMSSSRVTGVFQTSGDSSPSDSATLLESDATTPSKAPSKEPLLNLENVSPSSGLHPDHVLSFNTECDNKTKGTALLLSPIPSLLRVHARSEQ